MLSSSTPETTNPVSDQAETNEVPCVSTMARGSPGSSPAAASPSGLQVHLSFLLGPRRRDRRLPRHVEPDADQQGVGGLFPNDGDGNAWGDPSRLPAGARQGRLQAARSRPLFRHDGQFLGPDRRVQERRLRHRHRRRHPARLDHLPEAGEAAGLRAEGRDHRQGAPVPGGDRRLGDARRTTSSCEVWWAPSIPFKSSLTGADPPSRWPTPTRPRPSGNGRSLSASPTRCSRWPTTSSSAPGTGAARRDPRCRRRDQHRDHRRPHQVGRSGPFKNVSTTPLVGGQWRNAKGGPFKHDLVIVSNPTKYDIPVAGKMEAYS